jgi:hypothetical protein
LRLPSSLENGVKPSPFEKSPRGMSANSKEHSVTKPPPTPSENRSPKGTGDERPADSDPQRKGSANSNTAQQGQQGNIKQNTTNQGYQQDR